MNKEQINALLLGLFATAGPVAELLASAFHLSSDTIDTILRLCTVLTPVVAGAIFTYLQRDTAKVAAVASMPAEAQKAALNKVPDDVKVQIAEATPGVATVVVKDTANGKLQVLAHDDSHPNIVTETQNEADAKKGKKA